MKKLTLKAARAKLARMQSDGKAVAGYLNGACCDQEEEEVHDSLEALENVDFMLEQLQ